MATAPLLNYAPIAGVVNLTCPDKRFPVLSDGTCRRISANTCRFNNRHHLLSFWHVFIRVGIFLGPVIVGAKEFNKPSCAKAGFSVIPTKAECRQAAAKLSLGSRVAGSRKAINVEVEEVPEHLPYCASKKTSILGTLVDHEVEYVFDNMRVKEEQAKYRCNTDTEGFDYCVCKRGARDPIPRYPPFIPFLGAFSGAVRHVTASNTQCQLLFEQEWQYRPSNARIVTARHGGTPVLLSSRN